MAVRKILYISGTRADYGLMRQTLRAINGATGLSLTVTAVGMHLMREFGRTVSEIRADGFDVKEVPARYAGDERKDMSRFVGDCVGKLSDLLDTLKPGVILLLGDRGEMLAGAIAGLYCGILTVHIHGGEVTSTVDEPARHAITKLAHAHFCATQKAAQRVLRMGEERKRVFVTGAPGLDEIVAGKWPTAEYLSTKYHFDAAKPPILIAQHPVSSQIAHAPAHMLMTLRATKKIGGRVLVIYPNADAGGRSMIKVIKKFAALNRNVTAYPSVPHEDFLGLMKCAGVMAGNSSSGIVEAPSFGLPVVNIGERQRGRERGANVLECRHDTAEIARALWKAIGDKKFRERAKRSKNPYGDGKTAGRIVSLLRNMPSDAMFLQKSSAY